LLFKEENELALYENRASTFRMGMNMRAVVQRVIQARVEVDGRVVGKIESGLAVLLGVAAGDSESDADYIGDKIINLRIFSDADGRMNLSLLDNGGAILVVSQFTLYGDTRKGRRPSYTEAAQPEKANMLYTYFVDRLRRAGVRVETGVFQAHMQVNLTNDGPVTILIDSRKHF
jgi:D-tyrosyl-tRNA(Tyr) deacylase